MLSIAMFLCVISYGTIAISNDKGTVADLITEHRTAPDIRSVYYQPKDSARYDEVYAWDSEGLFSYLASLNVEKLSSSNEIHDIGGQSISVVVDNNGTMELNFLDKFIEVHHYHRRSYPEYYYLRSELDWDMITSYLDFDAERPVEPTLLWPEMQVHFDIPELGEPLFAIRNELRVWDMETGETLRASSNSDSPGGVSGANPTQAQLVFDMPVSEITVWMREWDSTAQTSISLEVESGSYFIPLDGNSAHYQVDVLYEPVDGIRYEATYAFDVEYPE